jgi:hypothetical protein
MGSGPRPSSNEAAGGANAYTQATQALDKLQSGGSSIKKLDPRMKYGHREFDYDIASDAGVFDKELSADRKVRRAQKRYRRKTK